MLSREGDDDDVGTVFRDTIMLALAGFVSLVVLMLPHLNPSRREAATEGVEPPGNVVVEVRWPDGIDADVDLWVEAPGDRPVGYSNKGGAFFNLLRDDLGHRADPTEVNYEVAYSRGVPVGEYTVNVHLYRDRRAAGAEAPVPVTVVASVKRSAGEAARPILTARVELAREGEERTAFRFRLDGDGALVPGSAHALQRPLRSARPAS
jgi:hypothetical protein